MGNSFNSYLLPLFFGLLGASLAIPVSGADPVRFTHAGVKRVLLDAGNEAAAHALIITLESQLAISRRDTRPSAILKQLGKLPTLLPWRGHIRRWAIRAEPELLIPELAGLITFESDVSVARTMLEAISLLDYLSSETQEAMLDIASQPLTVGDSRVEQMQVAIADAYAQRSERLKNSAIRIETITRLMDTFWRSHESVPSGILEIIARLDPNLKETLEVWLGLCMTPEMVQIGPLVSLLDKLGQIDATDRRIFDCLATWSDDGKSDEHALVARRAALRASLRQETFKDKRAESADALLRLAEAPQRHQMTRIEAVNALVSGLNEYQNKTTLLRANYKERVTALHATLSTFCGAAIALVVPTTHP